MILEMEREMEVVVVMVKDDDGMWMRDCEYVYRNGCMTLRHV